jgi:hypothetical protein
MDLALQELQERRTLLLEEIAELEKRRQQFEPETASSFSGESIGSN